MDNKKAKRAPRYRFNVVDLIIVLLVVACVAGVYIRSLTVGGSNPAASSDLLDDVELSFLVQDVRYTSAEFFENGEKTVYFADGSGKLGEFKRGFTITPAEKFITDSNGNTHRVLYPENTRIDVRGTILCKGTLGDNGFFLDGNNYIAAGSILNIATSDLMVTLVVTDVTKK